MLDFMQLQAQLWYEVKDFAPIIQSFCMIRRKKYTIRPVLPSVRQKIYARVRINVYFRKLIIK